MSVAAISFLTPERLVVASDSRFTLVENGTATGEYRTGKKIFIAGNTVWTGTGNVGGCSLLPSPIFDNLGAQDAEKLLREWAEKHVSILLQEPGVEQFQKNYGSLFVSFLCGQANGRLWCRGVSAALADDKPVFQPYALKPRAEIQLGGRKLNYKQAAAALGNETSPEVRSRRIVEMGIALNEDCAAPVQQVILELGKLPRQIS